MSIQHVLEILPPEGAPKEVVLFIPDYVELEYDDEGGMEGTIMAIWALPESKALVKKWLQLNTYSEIVVDEDDFNLPWLLEETDEFLPPEVESWLREIDQCEEWDGLCEYRGSYPPEIFGVETYGGARPDFDLLEAHPVVRQI
jgi:hypothetical protein